jgi:hypothetical protein
VPTEKSLVGQFKKTLRKLGYQVVERPVVGDTVPDFVVTSPTGTSAIVQAKTWEPSPETLRHASEIGRLYASSSGKSASYILLPHVPRKTEYANLVSPDNLDPLLDALKEPPSRRGKKRPVRKLPPPKGNVFIAMPFDRAFDRVYELAVKKAVSRGSYLPIRIDKQYQPGDVVAQIKTAIRRCAFVVADVSGSNPNVLFEAGYAEARNRPVIQICSTSLKDLPFDVRNNNTIRYTRSKLPSLESRLVKTIGTIAAAGG